MLRRFALAAVLLPSALAQAGGPPEVLVAPGLLAMARPVDCARFGTVAAWAAGHGYRFPAGDGRCEGRGGGQPAFGVGWNTAAAWANALSENAGLVPAYRTPDGSPVRDALPLGLVPSLAAGASGYRLPTLRDLGLPGLRSRMGRLQEWTGTRIDLGDGRPYYYQCRPGACDFHSPGTSLRGVGFRLLRTVAP